MTFLAFRPFRRRKHRNDVIVTSYIKILQILKLKSKDITSKTLHAKFYASRIKNKRIRRGVKYAPPKVWSVFKSPGKIGLTTEGKLKSVGMLADMLGKNRLRRLGFNIPVGCITACQAVMLNKSAEELPSETDITKADDIELQEIVQKASGIISEIKDVQTDTEELF